MPRTNLTHHTINTGSILGQTQQEVSALESVQGRTVGQPGGHGRGQTGTSNQSGTNTFTDPKGTFAGSKPTDDDGGTAPGTGTSTPGTPGANQGENEPPPIPPREWWEYLPFFNQMYEDKLANWKTEYDWWMTQNQRQYDSAQSQYDRYQQAGLNPNLMYDQMGQHSGGKGEAHMPKDTESFKTTLQGIAKGVMTAANIANIGSDTKLKATQAVTEATRAGLINEQKAGQKIRNILEGKTLPANIALRNLEAVGKDTANKLSKKQVEAIGHDIKYKQWVADLASAGLSVNDSLWMRGLYKQVKTGQISMKEFTEGFQKAGSAKTGNQNINISNYLGESIRGLARDF